VQSREELDPLVQLAIIHVKFEALHPFEDGNGRLGRMVIPLFLHERGVLSGPNFYMSGYLEARRDQYVDGLRAVSRDGAWTEWYAFFLQGLIEQASENQNKAQAIIDLHARMQHEIAERTHSQYAGRAVDFIFFRPIFATTHFVESAGIPRETAIRMLRALR
jgi:Fic family protein